MLKYAPKNRCEMAESNDKNSDLRAKMSADKDMASSLVPAETPQEIPLEDLRIGN